MSAALYSSIATRGAAAPVPRAILKLTGADRVRYLNGQVSNDVRKLTPGSAAMHACVMTAKGRMCADIVITATGDSLLIDAEPSLRETLAARLERYIISDDVILEDITDDLSLVHLIGIADSALPSAESFLLKRKSRRYGRDGWDILLTPQQASSPAWRDFAAALPALDDEMLGTLRIEAGIPRWGAELGEETIPVEAGLDRTAIDYHKGCYIGQEVISRIKSVGHVNKELRGFISATGTPLQPGMQLTLPGDPARKVGWLTSAAYSFALEKPVALGYLKRGTVADTLNATPADDAAGANTCTVLTKELPFIP